MQSKIENKANPQIGKQSLQRLAVYETDLQNLQKQEASCMKELLAEEKSRSNVILRIIVGSEKHDEKSSRLTLERLKRIEEKISILQCKLIPQEQIEFLSLIKKEDRLPIEFKKKAEEIKRSIEINPDLSIGAEVSAKVMQIKNRLDEIYKIQKEYGITEVTQKYAQSLAVELASILKSENVDLQLLLAKKILSDKAQKSNDEKDTLKNITDVLNLKKNPQIIEFCNYIKDISSFKADTTSNFIWYELLPTLAAISFGVGAAGLASRGVFVFIRANRLFSFAANVAPKASPIFRFLQTDTLAKITFRTKTLQYLAQGIGSTVGIEIAKELQFQYVNRNDDLQNEITYKTRSDFGKMVVGDMSIPKLLTN